MPRIEIKNPFSLKTKSSFHRAVRYPTSGFKQNFVICKGIGLHLLSPSISNLLGYIKAQTI